MATLAFDTLKTVEMLMEAGVEERRAKAIAFAMRDAVFEGVATREDVRRVGTDIQRVEDKLENFVTRADMYKLAFAMVAGQTALTVSLTVGLLKLLGAG